MGQIGQDFKMKYVPPPALNLRSPVGTVILPIQALVTSTFVKFCLTDDSWVSTCVSSVSCCLHFNSQAHWLKLETNRRFADYHRHFIGKSLVPLLFTPIFLLFSCIGAVIHT
ncbi:hypothetical protein HAX54_031065 [Datura stramonium]|uniref:Uncharacterized protein n=1 Tax=Datura stramonium TaxID=4076 RepID=A0ABS8VC20_DATST|nr:hypothetical protein [Datura stramonium]